MLTHSFTHPPTHSLTHSLTRSHTHSFTHSLSLFPPISSPLYVCLPACFPALPPSRQPARPPARPHTRPPASLPICLSVFYFSHPFTISPTSSFSLSPFSLPIPAICPHFPSAFNKHTAIRIHLLFHTFHYAGFRHVIHFLCSGGHSVCRVGKFRYFLKYRCCRGYRFKENNSALCVKGDELA